MKKTTLFIITILVLFITSCSQEMKSSQLSELLADFQEPQISSIEVYKEDIFNGSFNDLSPNIVCISSDKSEEISDKYRLIFDEFLTKVASLPMTSMGKIETSGINDEKCLQFTISTNNNDMTKSSLANIVLFESGDTYIAFDSDGDDFQHYKCAENIYPIVTETFDNMRSEIDSMPWEYKIDLVNYDIFQYQSSPFQESLYTEYIVVSFFNRSSSEAICSSPITISEINGSEVIKIDLEETIQIEPVAITNHTLNISEYSLEGGYRVSANIQIGNEIVTVSTDFDLPIQPLEQSIVPDDSI